MLDSPCLDGLSPAQARVLRLLVVGRSNKDIARELKISRQTVKNHITNIMCCLNLTRYQLIALAAATGYITKAELLADIEAHPLYPPCDDDFYGSRPA